MERNAPAAALCIALASSCMTLAGCGGAATEGTGNGEAASAEQLAMTLQDPWDAPNSVQRMFMDGSYADGTYTGTGQGMDGAIRVTLRIDGGRLSVVSMTQDGESQGRGGYEAIRDGVYAQRIEDAQGPEVDVISGATVTTDGVIQAVNDALAQARR